MDWKKCLILQNSTLSDAIESINSSAMQTAVIIGRKGNLLGTLTDGDIRRAILSGAQLSDEAQKYMCSKPHVIFRSTSKDEANYIMNKFFIHFLPIVDNQNVVVGVKLYEDAYISPIVYSNPVVIMAGGKGSRLGKLTKNTPKPMLKIHDKPILEIIIENFISQGFNNFWIAVNYLSDQIINHFEDGSKYDVKINYLEEKVRSGTAGALSLLPHTDLPILVCNADLLTKFNVIKLLDHHILSESSITMACREEEYTIPFGVIEKDKDKVIAIKEKPTFRFSVNAGIYVINPSTISLVPSNSYYDMTDLIEAAIDQNDSVYTYNIDDYWIDIGQPPQLDQALKDYQTHFHV